MDARRADQGAPDPRVRRQTSRLGPDAVAQARPDGSSVADSQRTKENCHAQLSVPRPRSRSSPEVLAAVATSAWATPPGKNGQIVFRRYLDAGKDDRSALHDPPGRNRSEAGHAANSWRDRPVPDLSPNGKPIAFDRKIPAPPAAQGRPGRHLRPRLHRGRDGKGLKPLVPCGSTRMRPFPARASGQRPPGLPMARGSRSRYSLVRGRTTTPDLNSGDLDRRRGRDRPRQVTS